MKKSVSAFKLNYICLAAAFGGVLFGFDTAVISGAIHFIKRQYLLDTAMEGWVVSSGLLGCLLGVALVGLISDRIGRKKTIVLAGLLFLLSGTGCAMAPGLGLFVAARMIGGMGVGVASVISPMYIAEFAPAAKRGRMIAWYQLAVTIGIVLAYFSNALIVSFTEQPLTGGWTDAFSRQEPWRPMFLVMAFPSALFLLLLARVPESPRWLVFHGQRDKAGAVLGSLLQQPEAAQELQAIAADASRSRQRKTFLFTRTLRLPLLIGIVLAVFQQFSGINAIIYYGPSIFLSAGIGGSNALVFQLIIGVVNIVFTIVAIWLADKYGRKALLTYGLGGIICSLVACGYLFYTGQTGGILLLVLLLVYIACFAFSLGPITWIVINEIFPTEVRVKGVAVCTMALWFSVWLVGQFFPWLLEKTGASVTFWLFAGCSLVNFFFSWKVVKETSGKTLEEMETLFVPPH